MRKRKWLNGIGMALALASLPLLSGCVAMASQEQLNALDQARKAAEASEADLSACKQKRADLERTLAQKKQLLQDKTAERDAVAKALKDMQ